MVKGVLSSALFSPLPSAIRFPPTFCFLNPESRILNPESCLSGAVEDEGAEGAEGFEAEALIEAKSA